MEHTHRVPHHNQLCHKCQDLLSQQTDGLTAHQIPVNEGWKTFHINTYKKNWYLLNHMRQDILHFDKIHIIAIWLTCTFKEALGVGIEN